jgi:hypothetical protein
LAQNRGAPGLEDLTKYPQIVAHIDKALEMLEMLEIRLCFDAISNGESSELAICFLPELESGSST